VPNLKPLRRLALPLYPSCQPRGRLSSLAVRAPMKGRRFLLRRNSRPTDDRPPSHLTLLFPDFSADDSHLDDPARIFSFPQWRPLRSIDTECQLATRSYRSAKREVGFASRSLQTGHLSINDSPTSPATRGLTSKSHSLLSPWERSLST
jgi:hypothetical protein